jgi:hypothetical protein
MIAFSAYFLSATGLPDGLHICVPKFQFGVYIPTLFGMENFGIFYGHSEYFTAIW